MRRSPLIWTDVSHQDVVQKVVRLIADGYRQTLLLHVRVAHCRPKLNNMAITSLLDNG